MTQKGSAGQIIKGLVTALSAGMAVTLLCAMVAATLISGETIGQSGENLAITVTLLLSSAIAALTAAGLMKNQRLLMCLAGSGAYLLALMCCAAAFFDGVRGNVGVTVLLTAGAALAVALLGGKGRKTTKYKRPKHVR